jgi:protein SCO1/2
MKRFLWLLPIVMLASSCASSSRHTASADAPDCCASDAELHAGFSDDSLYQLESVWTNDLGQPTSLGASRGRAQVVAMFFANCAYACPIIVHDMQRIESALPTTARAHTGFTLVTFDTDRDTPEALRAYRGAHELPADRWTLLRGSPDDTLELAMLLGVKYKKDAGGQFAHSNLITILNEEGEIIHQLIGLNHDVAPAVERITQALTESDQVRLSNE